MFDNSLINLIKANIDLESIEISKCENITDYLLQAIKDQGIAPSLKSIELNMIPALKEDMIEEFWRENPNLIIRWFMFQKHDAKDNGLRKPLRPLKEKKKEKKKKKKKKR